MAEVAKNVVSEHERPEPEELSLQQLIDTELALRAPPPNKSQSFTLDFLEAEREAAGRCAPNSPPLIVIDPVVVANGTDSPSPPPTEPFEKKVDDDSKNTKIVEEFSQFINGDVGGGVGEAVGVTDEWTTVEEVALELTGEGGGDRALAEPQPQQPPVATLTELTTSCATNNSDGSTTEIINTTITTQILHEESSKIHQTVICSPSDIETPSTDKKKKKKSVAENGSGANSTAKVKKTKKKKTEEKENHISVMTNGHEYGSSTGTPPLSPSSLVVEDDLANVCVKNLKLNYVNETTKSFSGHTKSSEVPVPPPVSIRELRRSFGDLHKACEASEEEHSTQDLNGDVMRGARSLGDLSRIDRPRPIVTGVSVKELAAAYWRTVSIENNLNEHCNKRIGRLDKSSFSKFDQLSKKTVLHVRSSDPAKASKTFSQGDSQGTSTCKACDKTVFAMEQIKAERAVWHKNCFRCHTCKKQLTVDIYSSHEGLLYCKPHFKDLFKPKVVVDQDEEPVRRRKPEMIIRENQPVELPPDVVRASDKSDLGLKELNLDVKSMFRVFEKSDETDGDLEKSPTTVSVKRSSSIMSKLAKFQKKGMDIGVSEEALNGFVCEETSSSSEEEEEELDEVQENGVVKSTKKLERPMSFGKIDDVKKNWESAGDQHERREKLREQKKEELQNLRSRLFMGKQVKMKELYEQAVAESEGKSVKKDEMSDIVRSEKAKVVREKFEKGEPVHSDSEEESKTNKKGIDEDISIFEEGISKKSRSLFLQMDANVAKITPPPSDVKVKKPKEVRHSKPLPTPPPSAEDIVRSSDKVEDVVVETADVSSKFKFFETFKPKEVEKKKFRITPPREGQVKSDSPEREVYRDPDVIRCDEKLEDDTALMKSQTTSRMLSMFRQMEEHKEVLPEGPKPKKCFTPPPDYKASESEESEASSDDDEDEDDDEESETEDGVVKSSYKVDDEYLKQSKNAARAKQLAAKFESWEPDQQSNNNAITMLDSEHASIDSTKSLRAKFESLKSEEPKEKSRPKVNRFVETTAPSMCAFCEAKVYPLEKIETNGKMFHKQCFRCSYCNCILRMDSYTLNNGHLYCLPHFKQLFISKGNYDEGFGSNQHKRKWETPAN